MKTALIVLSDPKSGGDDALGRVFGALTTAYDLKERGEEAVILFQGAGTRWPEVLSAPEHPAHGLYELVLPMIDGISCYCAEAFGASEGAEATGLPILKDNAIPGTSGVTSFGKYLADGYTLVTF